jgi:fibronectin type 3 domain-containing protein
MGLNQAAASGILANIYRESGFNPTVNGDNGTSYGICQWRNSRKTNLINYCKQKGYDYTSLTGQLYFLKYELETSYPQIYTYMRNAANTEQGAYLAGYYWCYNFEIPANTENTSIERGNLAKVIYWPKYKNVDSVPRISEVKNVSTGVQVKWTEVKDANGYYIYRRTSQDGAWQMIHKTAKGTVGSYTDKNVISSKTYTYAVVAYFESDDAMVTTSEMSDEESILYLAMPEVTGASIVNSGVKVTWNKVSGAKGYYIYRKTATSDYVRIAKVSGGSSEVYTDKTVESGITYTYTVRAYASDAWGSCNSNATVKYLESPEIVSAQVVKNGIKLTWTEVKGATYYYVYRKNDGERYTRIAKVSKESIVTYTDTTAVSGTTYTYTVRACANDAWGCCNSTASVGYLAAPNVTSAKVVSNGIKVNWQKVSGAKGYYVYRKTAGKGWTRIAKIASASAVNYTDTTVESGIVYTYMVRAYSGSIAGNYNKQVSNMYLTQPSLSSATIVNNNDIKVTWKQVAGAKGYYVYRKTEGSGWTRIAKVSKAATVSYTDTTAASGTAYTYTVRAFNGTYGSAYDAAGVSCKLPQKLILYKTTDKLNYRTGPGTTYTVSGTLNRDVTVQVVSGYSSTANGNTWYKIYLNNQYYYVSASYLKKYKS